jgi:hypothetical protein
MASQITASYSVSYAFNSEGNLAIQDYEMKLSSTPVTAKVMKLKTLWSEEADQNLQAMYNIKAESVLLNALTNALTYQKHRQVIFDLRAKADAGFVVWDAIAPSGVNYQTHKFSIIDAFETASNFIFGRNEHGCWQLAAPGSPGCNCCGHAAAVRGEEQPDADAGHHLHRRPRQQEGLR